jgi:diguanylate cyclase (GGDEF)-like protein
MMTVSVVPIAAVSLASVVTGVAVWRASVSRRRLRAADDAVGALRASEKRMRAVIETAGDAFIGMDERKRLEDELTRQALHDPVTGLPNRTLLLDRLGHALTRGERGGAPVTVLFLDLDDFKTVNDSVGHAAGDRLLGAVAERLVDLIRPPDTVARLGGDEFAVLLEDTRTVDGVRVARRLGDALDTPFLLDGHQVFARASVGVASGDPGQQTADDVLRNADLAMYIAKGRGKARYAVFESGMHAAVVERLELEADLRQALGRGEFFLRYQPVVRLADGSVVGMEALIRWKRAGGDVVSPDQFIPVAEETGLIRDIGRWVLQEACWQAAAWQAEHTPTPALRLSVNLSARHLQDPGLVKDVEAVLAASGLDPACLVIEITESLLMSEPDVAIQRLGDLKHLGVKLAIDDFGTGYSSLSYLRRFPVDVLKVDRSFVTALGRDPGDAALTHAIVKLGQTLQLRVVAEGIETAAQLAELQALECEYGQGYLFAPPLATDAMSVVLADAAQGTGLLPPKPPSGDGRLPSAGPAGQRL